MSGNPSPAAQAMETLLARTVTPLLKAAGFRRRGVSFHRRRGEAVQVVHFEASHGSDWSERQFYVDVGIAFESLCRLSGVPVLEQPKEYQCADRGTRDRLESLLENLPEGAPERWTIRAGEDIAGVAARLGRCLEALVAELDRIDGPAAYRNHPWFDRDRPAGSSAQVLYLLGDLEGARREVRELAREFADRENADRPEWWMETLGLAGLSGDAE